MAEAAKTVQVAEGIRAFGIDDDSSVMLRCPDCEELLWLTNPEDISTLGDVIDAVTAHQCPPEVLAALSGEETPGEADRADVLADLLSLVGVTVTDGDVEQWTAEQREAAWDWAAREHLHASDNPVERRPKPTFLDGAEERS